MKLYIQLIFAFVFDIIFSCTSLKHVVNNDTIKGLKFLSEYDVPFNKNFQHTTIGGLSGIDYDDEKKVYYFISDDRSEKNPARFYEAKIIIEQKKIDSVVFLDTKFLKNKEGNTYPDSQTDPYHTPDPEAIRYNALNHTFVWSSEGERIVKPGKIILEDPAVTEIDANANYIDTFSLSPQMHMQPTESGPRQNGVFEGLTFADNYKTLLVNVEEPLYDDGSRAGLHDSTGTIRIIKYDVAAKKSTAQYAYITDPVAYAPVPENAFKINSVPDILSVDKNKLLVVERSFSTGRLGCTIKIFLADISSAEDIKDITSLKDNPQIKTIPKTLLLNMNNLGIYIDNIEGVTFGSLLPDGHRTLLFVSDNNFQFIQKTQFLLFEIE